MLEISFTAYYIIILIISIILNLICPFLKIYWYFAFSIKQIKENFQIWRLFTNYLIKPSKQVNIGTLIEIISLYTRLYSLEESAQKKNKYSKFIMIIVIIWALNLLFTLLLFFIFDIKESRSLISELSYSLTAISSYDHPNDKTFVSYIPLKNKYAPIGILIMRIIANKDISVPIIKSPLIGFLSGFLFCILTKKLKIKYIPLSLKKLLNEPLDNEIKIQLEKMKKIQKDYLNKKNNKDNKDNSKKEKKLEKNSFKYMKYDGKDNFNYKEDVSYNNFGKNDIMGNNYNLNNLNKAGEHYDDYYEKMWNNDENKEKKE